MHIKMERGSFKDDFSFATNTFLVYLIQRHFDSKLITGVELGTAEGTSAYWLTTQIPGIAVLHTIDPYKHFEGSSFEQARPQEFHERMLSNARISLTPLGSRILMHRMCSDEFFSQTISKSLKFSFIWIDGHHEGGQVERDINNSLQWVEPGGLICGHDYFYDGVQGDVRKVFGNAIAVDPESTIWWVKIK